MVEYEYTRTKADYLKTICLICPAHEAVRLIEAAYKNQTIYVQFHNDTTFGTGVLTIKREPEVKIPVEDFVKLDADFIIEEITQLFEMTIVNMDLLKYEKFKSMKHRLDMQFDRSFIRHPN